ncbi:hypothetical protein [Parasphingorhabdus halotolerans]|uniref:Uncharacterized protein n=1 Tax=Parasphingorhabdus halotolerans TaxID=2725558 RepID=A0A6H2DLV4_9SPHN|nr:hypothetical protein [Parasphingorhabdus halotolerans]QJB69178.1 hypothetical protein HF685_07725 [Parasphingorhabdus halotolerans]
MAKENGTDEQEKNAKPVRAAKMAKKAPKKNTPKNTRNISAQEVAQPAAFPI